VVSKLNLFFLLTFFCLFGSSCLKIQEKKSRSLGQGTKQNSITREFCHGILIYRIYRKELMSLESLLEQKGVLIRLKNSLKQKSRVSLNLTRNRLTISGKISSFELEALLKKAYQEKLISEIIVTGFLVEKSLQNRL